MSAKATSTKRPHKKHPVAPRVRAKKVLFLCIGNACRSQMAEALARHHASDVIVATSAGLAPLGYIASPTSEVLLENGVSCEGQTSKSFRDAAAEGADLLVNMSGHSVANYFQPGKPPVEDWDVGDPYGLDREIYRRIRDEIERRVLDLADRLRAAAAL